MKSHPDYLLMSLCLVALSSPMTSPAATIWTGPPMNFVNIAGTDPTQAANEDRLTANVWITRGTSQGLWNAATESGFTHFLSPQGTEWTDGLLANHASLSYTNWNSWAKFQHGGPPGTLGVNAVVHLIAEDIYLSVTFTSWGMGTGGFTYARSTPLPAVRLIIKLTGNELDISWPQAGGRLQVQTNGLGTTWFTVPNSTTTNHMFIPIDPANGSVFYRLALP
jgi:hypothetical protein